MKRTESVKRAASTVMAIALVVVVVAALKWPETKELVHAYDPFLKIMSSILGPFFLVLGFFFGLIDKAEIQDLSVEKGKAEEAASQALAKVEAEKKTVQEKVDRIGKLEETLATIVTSERFGRLRKNSPFPEYRGWKHDPEGAKVVTVGLFKGGVGKSHVAANFAAYASEKLRKRVLLIDLDYQGSLSSAVMTAAGIEPTGSRVDDLLKETANLSTVIRSYVQLSGQPSCALNNGTGMPRVWLVPADYTLSEEEGRLLVDRIINDRDVLDERYRLAHVLLQPDVRRAFDLIILDTPPRMTLGTVNALVASHAYIVPVKADKVSSEAVEPFLTQIKNLQGDLQLDLKLAGIIGTMTKQIEMSRVERDVLNKVKETVQDVLGGGEGLVLAQNLPNKAQITNDSDLGYFLTDPNNGPLSKLFYDKIFDELWKNIMEAPNRPNE